MIHDMLTLTVDKLFPVKIQFTNDEYLKFSNEENLFELILNNKGSILVCYFFLR